MNTGILILVIISALIAAGIVLSVVRNIKLLRIARAGGVELKMSNIVGMKIRRTNAARLIALLVKAKQAGVTLTSDMLEAHRFAGGRADRVVDSLIAAKQAGLPLEFRLASAIDLSGGSPAEFVESAKAKGMPFTQESLWESGREYIKGLGDMAKVVRMARG